MCVSPADMRASSVVIRPTPKHEKMNARSLCMPSTAWSIEPSLPRRALPVPHTDTAAGETREARGMLSICVAKAWVLPNAVSFLPNVVEAVHMRLAQIEMVTKRCKQA